MVWLPNTVGFIQNLVVNPCARPWYIWVQTFVPAAVEFAITVALLDFEDVVRARGEQLARSGGRASRRGKGHTGTVGVPVIPGDKERYARGGLKTLLVLTAPLEFIGFGLLVYGATERFSYNWQWYLDQSDFCSRPIEVGPLIRTTGERATFPNGALGALQLPNLIQDRAGWGSGNISVQVPEGQYQAILAITIVGPGGGGATYRGGLNVLGTSGTGAFRGDPVFAPTGEEVDLLDKFDIWFPLIGINNITWGIVGPPVPIGLVVKKARFILERVG